ncbi:hypothetical protein ABMA28_000320 [Loxostege sticticalis]|uniref:Uncharacterized protein n=1 Tax=Loxostege sticticalis TaxID=481309 RepID=A0ABD0TRU3_LOXSC
MHSLVPLLFAAVAVCARPPGPTQAPDRQLTQPQRATKISHDYLEEYYLPRILMPQYLGFDGSPRVPLPPRDNDWLNKEIDRINRMDEEAESMGSYEKDIARMIVEDPYLMKMFESPMRHEEADIQDARLNEPQSAFIARDDMEPDFKPPQEKKENPENVRHEQRKDFAFTPLEKGYFDPYLRSANYKAATRLDAVHHEGGDISSMQIEPPRQIRQNPNLSKTKTLVAEHLDRLRSGLSSDDSGTTEKPRSIHMMEAATVDPADSIYGVAIIAAVGTAITLAIVGFAFGWYTMTKRAKAAADVDYPAYGVTGPTMDMSGDRKLAHSAHMYHYQHQKQQIIAMERNGMEQRNGSVSDPESEEENEEGDYTVYECPGFATTGDMEVKNPLFSEDPTPATPGKCELVKPQPKD